MAGGSSRERRRFLLCAAAVLLAGACLVFARFMTNFYWDKLLNFFGAFLLQGVFFVWGVSVSRRIFDPYIRRALISVSVLSVFWLVLREFKFRFVSDPGALRFLWYLYYVPLLLIPLAALLVSLSLGRSGAKRARRWAPWLIGATVLPVFAVLTNDLHQWAFRFPAGAVWSEADYRYGPVYFIAAGWGILCSVAAVVRMMQNVRIPKTRRIMWLPLIPVAAAVAYVILYALNIAPIRRYIGDVAIWNSLIFISFFECCIQCGLIPTNTRYADLFRACSGISMQITDEGGRIRFSAGDLSAAAGFVSTEQGSPILLPDGKCLHTGTVTGGKVIWLEDLSQLHRLRETLHDRQEELRERNALLQYEYDREKEHKTVEEKNRLYDLLQQKTQRQLEQIRLLTGQYRAVVNEEERKKILRRIGVLGTYIKRREELVLSSDLSGSIPQSALTNALRESFRALRQAGVRGGFRVDTGAEEQSGELLAYAYDFFESAVESLPEDAVFLNVSVCPVHGVLRCRVMTDGRIDGAALQERYPDLTVLREDGTVLILPLKGGVPA